MRTALYRWYDAHGVLLYVGVSENAARRAFEHAGEKPWWQDVAQAVVEHHETRVAAEEAERIAIRAERPLHNVTHAYGGEAGRAHARALGHVPAFVSIAVAASMIGLSKSSATRRALEGEIPTVAFGRRRVVPTCWLYERAARAADAWRAREAS